TFDDGTVLSLNVTNTRTLARAYGTDSDKWVGKEIKLVIGNVDFQGKPQEAIIVEPISPPIENKAKPKCGDDLNDEDPVLVRVFAEVVTAAPAMVSGEYDHVISPSLDQQDRGGPRRRRERRRRALPRTGA